MLSHDRLSRLLSRRLLWRLSLLFLVGAMLPVALSDWLAVTVVADVAQTLGHDRRAEAERAVGKQVLDRLLVGEMLLASQAPGGSASKVGSLSPFLARSCLAVKDAAPAGTDADAFRRALRDASSAPSSAPLGATRLTAAFEPGHSARVFIVRKLADGTTCAAEFDNDYLWGPLRNSADDGSWAVLDESGRTLTTFVGADASDPAQQGQDKFSSRLSLRAEFDAPGWTFEQTVPPVRVEWHRWRLGNWLAAVASATLLAIGLIAQWRIRRTLGPLERLTDGTRRLAAGEASVRVNVKGQDEFGILGNAFNEMAVELDARMNALVGLSRIDAGILAGASFPDLVNCVMERLSEIRPDHWIAVAWLDTGATLAVRTSMPRAVGFVDRVLTDKRMPIDVASFERLPDSLVAASPGHPALPLREILSGDIGSGSNIDWLPLRIDSRLQAVIALEISENYAAARPSCLDVRDRLAVAIITRNREEALVHMARHDDLTGLANRFALYRELDRKLEAIGNDVLAVLFIDLDNFKQVNDSYGHETGDRILVDVARRLRTLAPSSALVARQGGDEFVVVLSGTANESVHDFATALVAALARPFEIAGVTHRCGASLGIAMSPQHGTERDELLRCADVALYDAKSAGRGCYRLFDPALDVEMRSRAQLLAELRIALERDEIVVHYQPRLSAATLDIRSAEALVRWEHPVRGLLFPGSFVELAESSGLIRALGLHVLDVAIAQVAAWQEDGLALDRVSVNVSALQFTEGNLVDDIHRLLAQHAVEGCRIELEVTESLLGDVDRVRPQLDALRALGLTIAMDDFGTGYSSLSLLRQLPIDVMKVDRAFVTDLEQDMAAVAVARTIVNLAQALDLDIVAEGIETPGQAAMLISMGCHELQGFLYSKALPADTFRRLPALAHSSVIA